MPSERTPSLAEITHLLNAAGYREMRPLQEKLIPLILKGRDVAAQAEPGSGKTTSYLLTYMAALRGVREGVRVLILVADPESVRRIAREHQRFSRVVRDAPSLLVVGDTEDARREQRRLEGAPVILAGTVERVIDHIRRGSLSFARLTAVVIEQPEGELAGDFIRDVHFIFAKLPPRRQVILFTGGSLASVPPEPTPEAVQASSQPGDWPPSPGEHVEGILELLHHPALLPKSELSAGAGVGTAERSYIEVAGADKADVLWRVLLSRGAAPALVLHSVRADGERLARSLVSFQGRVGSLSAGIASAARRRLISEFENREIDVLLVPLPVPGDVDPSRAALLVYYDVPIPRPLSAPAGAGSSRRPDSLAAGRSVVLVDHHQARDFQRLQETLAMTMNREEVPADRDVVRGSIERILRRVKEQEDPAELERLRADFRRHVPLFLRSYVAAYLLKAQLPRLSREERAPAMGPEPQKQGERGPARGRAPSAGRVQAPQGAGRKAANGRPAQPAPVSGGRRQTAPEPQPGLTQLFVSIGRNRRVYPRDLTDLFTQTLRLRADEIGSVRVFDKYSFVEIATSRAGEAISQLSGKDFKGRPISVNFAKKRGEKEGS